MRRTFILFSLLLQIACHSQNCPDGINKLPMFGKVQKCKGQIEADNIFLKEEDKMFSNRHEAANYIVSRAWDYFYQNLLDSAMMRFNQAWLLDSLNSEIYWGYGNILGKQQKFNESMVYFEKSLKINPNNSKVWQCASTSLGQLFFQTKDQKLLNKTIDYLKKSISLDPKNANALGQLTASYCYFIQKDSALKYLKETDMIDPSMINPEVRKILDNKN
jgi:tetratricopeptide (TPR) repeat protein